MASVNRDLYFLVGATRSRLGWQHAVNVNLATGVALFLGSLVFYLFGSNMASCQC